MHSCLAAVKTSMLVIQRSQEIISATVLQAEQNHCKLKDTLSSLLGCYTHILTDGKTQDSETQLMDVDVCDLFSEEVISLITPCNLLCFQDIDTT